LFLFERWDFKTTVDKSTALFREGRREASKKLEADEVMSFILYSKLIGLRANA